MGEQQTILVRVSGPDRPGITTELLSVLARAEAEIQDIEQVVIRRRLNLGLVVEVPTGRDLLKELLLYGWDHEVDVDFEIVDATPTAHDPPWAVTVIGSVLHPEQLAAATAAIADSGGNIDRIVRLSKYPVMSYEFTVEGGDVDKMRAYLVDAAARHRFDVAVQRDDLGRRAKRLVVLDVDSTLIQDEAIDLLAAAAGKVAEVAAITERAMAGELDFEQSLRQRVRLLAGLPESVLAETSAHLRLTPGAKTFVRTLHRLGYRLAIISGGFDAFTSRLRDDLGLAHAHANRLEIVDGVLTGELDGPILDRARKAELLVEIAAAEGIPTEQTVAVGDGANDLDMLSVAGLGIAFNAKPVVRDAADTAVTVPYLDVILFILGLRREDVERADAVDPERPTP